MKSGIYRITCLINGKIYIGSAVDILQRWRKHKCELNKNIHHNKILQNSWIKYGEENFHWDVIEYCSIKILLKKEQYYINYLKPQFNILLIAGSSLGHKHSEETKRKISIANKGRKTLQEIIDRLTKMRTGRKYNKIKKRFSNKDIKDIKESNLFIYQIAKKYSCNIIEISNIKKGIL